VLNTAANPLVPSLAEAMRQALTSEETDHLTAHLQPQVEQGHGKQRSAIAYLSATATITNSACTGVRFSGPILCPVSAFGQFMPEPITFYARQIGA
jgi:hypothetical protein